jgi:hypothetical protein
MTDLCLKLSTEDENTATRPFPQEECAHVVTQYHIVSCTPVVDVKVLLAVHHLVFLDTLTQVAEGADGGGAASAR